jgi:hypothetical protein
MVANDSAFVIGRRGVRDAMNDFAIALENRAQFAYERHQLQHALADDRRRLLVRREILDSLQRSQPRNFAQLRVERENLASAWLGLGWHYLVAGIADTAVLANRQVPRFDGTNDYWIPNELNALLITGRIAEADSVFRRHARAQVERPRVPFPCAVLRDLEVTLIPRGAARAEHVTQAEELFRKHSPISPAECSHRKSPRTP